MSGVLARTVELVYNLAFGCDICHARRVRLHAATLVHPDGRRIPGATVCESCRAARTVR